MKKEKDSKADTHENVEMSERDDRMRSTINILTTKFRVVYKPEVVLAIYKTVCSFNFLYI